MTRNWNDLPNELKWMIVDRMDIITRFRLKMCSKSDKCLVETVPFYCDKVSYFAYNRFADKDYRGLQIAHTRISTEGLLISDDAWESNDTASRYQFAKCSSREESIEMIKCMFHAFMSPQNVRIGQFITNLELTDIAATPNFKIHVNKLNLRGVKDNEKWLSIVANQPEELEIDGGFRELLPVIKNAKRLHWRCASHSLTNNDQLMQLKATDLYIADSNITEEGINAYIKKMIKEDYPIGSEMYFIRNNPRSNWDKLMDGLNSEPVPGYESDDDLDNFLREPRQDYPYDIHRRYVLVNMPVVEKVIVVTWTSDAYDTVELSVCKRQDDDTI